MGHCVLLGDGGHQSTLLLKKICITWRLGSWPSTTVCRSDTECSQSTQSSSQQCTQEKRGLSTVERRTKNEEEKITTANQKRGEPSEKRTMLRAMRPRIKKKKSNLQCAAAACSCNDRTSPYRYRARPRRPTTLARCCWRRNQQRTVVHHIGTHPRMLSPHC